MSVMSRRRTLAAIALGALFAGLSTARAAFNGFEPQTKRKGAGKQAETAKTRKLQNFEELQNQKLRNFENQK